MKLIAEKTALLRWGAHYEGWPFTIFRTAVKAFSLMGIQATGSAWFQWLAERRYDKRFNVDTRGTVKSDELQLPDDRKMHTLGYVPTTALRFGWLLSKLPVDLSKYVFIDFGSGKGRVLQMASEFPFKRVLGVELDRELHDVAIQNTHRFRSRRCQCDEVHSLNQDATEFEFSHDPLVLFFYNPFSAEILSQVINRLESSLREKPRPVIAIYYNSLFTSVFEESPFFEESNLDFHPGVNWKIYTTQTDTPQPSNQ